MNAHQHRYDRDRCMCMVFTGASVFFGSGFLVSVLGLSISVNICFFFLQRCRQQKINNILYLQ